MNDSIMNPLSFYDLPGKSTKI